MNTIIDFLKGLKKEKAGLKIHVGAITGSFDYYMNFKKKHPTYKTIESDFFN